MKHGTAVSRIPMAVAGRRAPLARSRQPTPAAPNVQGCMGNAIAYAAHTLAPIRQFVAPLARAGGVARDVHTIQAGGFTDEEFPDSCN